MVRSVDRVRFTITRVRFMDSMTIGKAAEMAGVGVETVRFYERRRLISQPLKPIGGGYRHYPEATVERIRFVRQAQELGFSLREIGELLALRADPDADSSDVKAQAETKLDEVIEKIVRLEEIRGALETVIAACPGRGPTAACSILEAMSNRDRAAKK